MIHKFLIGKSNKRPTLLLLHGTGGNENDLIPLAQAIDAEANILSVRGEVIEAGMPRFFKRLSPGVFDEQDLIYRTSQLHDFLDKASKQYSFDRQDVIAIGYSNGANIAASMILHIPRTLKGAILLHPMLPRVPDAVPNLSLVDILITAGNPDPIVPLERTNALVDLLKENKANVTVSWFTSGHKISPKEVENVIEWYNNVIIQTNKNFH